MTARLSDLTPTNYLAEKARFLNDPTFNPQFTYLKTFDQEALIEHGLPQAEYLTLAQKIVDETFGRFTKEQLQAERGALLDQETVSRAVKEFLAAHQLEERFSIVWSADFVSRAAVNGSEVRLRLPCAIHEEDLEGLLFHELGTHVLRRINYEQQPWYKKKSQFGFGPYLKTEEGLAALHALHHRPLPLVHRPAINYLAVEKAQHGSFLEVWQFVKQYVVDDESAFTITFKKKRGLADTSQPGGFTKDLVYFEGLVDITRFLTTHNFPVKELYFGKLAYQDIPKAVELNPGFQPLLPTFYTRDPAAYQEHIHTVARTNFI